MTINGVLLAGISYALFPVIQSHVPSIHSLVYLATGLGALGLARNPDGVMSMMAPAGNALRRTWAARRAEPVPGADDSAPVRDEEESLAGAAG